MHEPASVFITGTFDVANYGDLLFPMVAQARLADEGYAVRPVSPTNRRTAYADAPQPVDVAAMLDPDGPKVEGILVGGGYILTAMPALGLPTYEAADVVRYAYPSLWIGASVAGALRDVPVLWNAPGAPFPFVSHIFEDIIRPALAAVDRRCVRDAASANLFRDEAASFDVIPDTALDLPRVWPKARLLATHAALLARKGAPAGTRCLAVHVRARAFGDPQTVAAQVDRCAEALGLTPILLGIGPELGDLKVLRDLSALLKRPHLSLHDPERLEEIAAAIAGSGLYLGCSLHGYVTAAAYKVPAVLLAASSARGKYGGLLRQLDRMDDLASDWPSAVSRAQMLAAGGPPRLPASVAQALDRHWTAMAECLRRPEAGRQRRLDFLRRYMRAGARREGADWMLRPQLSGGRSSRNDKTERPSGSGPWTPGARDAASTSTSSATAG